MKKLFATALIAIAIAITAGCAVTGGIFGPTPEAQIATGANLVTAQAGVATVLLKNKQISVTQAKGYSGLLHAAGGHLEEANKALLSCRARTGSTAQTNPDPCKATVADDIALGLSVAGEVKRTLDARR